MRFIHIADVHLGMVPDVGRPWSGQRAKEIWASFFGVLKECSDKQIDLLLIAGDLFHKRPRIKDLKELDYAFSKLKKTKVVIVAGNHDYVGADSPYRSFKWESGAVFLGEGPLQEISFASIDTKVYGFSFERRSVTEWMLDPAVPAGKEEFHILLAHGGEENYAPVNWEKLKSAGFHYVAMGHIHKPGKIAEHIIYPGSLEPLNRKELGHHGYVEGELVREGGEIRLKSGFVPFARRQYLSIDIEVTEDMTDLELKDSISRSIEKNGREHIYNITLKGFRNKEEAGLIQEMEEIGNISEVRDETKPNYDFERLLRENRYQMIGLFIEAVRKSGAEDEVADKALYFGIGALLQDN